MDGCLSAMMMNLGGWMDGWVSFVGMRTQMEAERQQHYAAQVSVRSLTAELSAARQSHDVSFVCLLACQSLR